MAKSGFPRFPDEDNRSGVTRRSPAPWKASSSCRKNWQVINEKDDVDSTETHYIYVVFVRLLKTFFMQATIINDMKTIVRSVIKGSLA